MKKTVSILLSVLFLLSAFSPAIAQDADTRAWQDNVSLVGVVPMDPKDTEYEPRWIENTDDAEYFVIDNTWFADNHDVYMQAFAPATEDGKVIAYAKDDVSYFNYSLGRALEEGDIEPLCDIPVYCYLFGTTDGSAEGYKMLYEWKSMTGSISGTIVAPYDNFVYNIVVIIDDAELSDFGALVTVSTADMLLCDAESENEIGLGDTVEGTFDAETETIAIPAGDEYITAPFASYRINLSAGKAYSFETENALRAFVLDENMDIAGSYVGVKSASMLTVPAVDDNYTLVVAGENGTTAGAFSFKVNEIEASFVDVAIDLSNLSETATEYAYDADAKTLELYDCGTYTLTGKSVLDITLRIYGGTRVILEDAEIASVDFLTYDAPATLEIKGHSHIVNGDARYTITNAQGALCGAYIVGHYLYVEAKDDSMGAIMFDNAALHFNLWDLEVISHSVEGYYPVSMWVIGKDHPHFTNGNEYATYYENAKTSEMYYTPGWFYGYTVSDFETVTMYGGEHSFYEASTRFILSDELDYMPGDADKNGKVNTYDAVIVLKYSADMITLDRIQMLAGEVIDDGVVNTLDAAEILRYCADMRPAFPKKPRW